RQFRARFSFEKSPVSQRLASLPWAIAVAEVYAFAQRRMARLPQFDQDIGAWHRQVLFLQFDEGGRGRVVVPRDLKSEPVGLVFVMARVGQGDGRDDQEIGAEEQYDQRQ